MTETDHNSRTNTEVQAIREQYAEEEAEAAEAEIAVKNAALDVPLNLRITKGLDAQLRRQAADEQIPIPALVRRLLIGAVNEHHLSGLTEAEVEAIARRVMREESLSS